MNIRIVPKTHNFCILTRPNKFFTRAIFRSSCLVLTFFCGWTISVDFFGEVVPHFDRQIAKCSSTINKAVVPLLASCHEMIWHLHTIQSNSIASSRILFKFVPLHRCKMPISTVPANLEVSAVFAKADVEHSLVDDAGGMHGFVDGLLLTNP